MCKEQTHIVGSCFDLLVEFVLVLIPEWRISNQKDVENHTYTCKKKKKAFNLRKGGGIEKSRDEKAYHTPKCRQVYRTPLSSAPLGTSSQEFQQSLHNNNSFYFLQILTVHADKKLHDAGKEKKGMGQRDWI